MPACSAQYDVPCARNLASGPRQVQRNIMHRGNDPPQFARANQNITAAAMLLRGLPEPNNPQEQVVHWNLRALVETAAAQQAEGSAS